jgi:uncharacterized membrane protein
MSNTYGGWNPRDPYGQDPQPQSQPQPEGTPPQAPQPFDPYGPLDPYGRPANPYGRPDYQPQQLPQRPQPQQPQQQPEQWQPQQWDAQPGFPQHSVTPETDPETEHRPDLGGPPATVGHAWRWGWSSFGASWGTWVLMSVLLGVAQLAAVLLFSPSTMDGLMNATDPAAVDAAQAAGRTLTAKGLAAGGTAVCFLLQALLYAGALAATRKRSVALRDFFVLRGFGGLVAYALITGALGFASTVVPVVGWLVQVVFTLLLLPVPFLILKGAGFGRALVGGVGLVLSHLGSALAVFAIFAGLALASLFTCGIGLVVVAPAMLLVGAYLVQRWTGEPVHV